MSKSTQFIVVITSMAVVCSAAASIRHFSASGLLVATVGGLVVFAGLWIEKDADEDKEKHLCRFSSAKRMIKLRSNIGWWVLMFGIGIEIADAGWTAHEIRISDAKNNPANQPITYLAALVTLDAHSTNFRDFDPVKFPNSHFATLQLGEYDWVKSNIWAIRLICKSCEIFGNPDARTWYLEYGISPEMAFWNLKTNDMAAVADKWDTIRLDAPYLRPNDKILHGEITVIVNQTIKHFPIPPQIADPKYGSLTPSFAPSNGVRLVVASGP